MNFLKGFGSTSNYTNYMATDKITLLQHIEQLTDAIGSNPDNAQLYLQRGKLYHQGGTFDKALNDFMQVLRLDPDNTEAQQYSLLVKEIFAYHYVDQFNP